MTKEAKERAEEITSLFIDVYARLVMAGVDPQHAVYLAQSFVQQSMTPFPPPPPTGGIYLGSIR